MRRLVTAALVMGGVGFTAGATQAQVIPSPSPTTTIPESAVGTCRIEGVSPAYGEDRPDLIVGVDVFLRCAETTERTSLHHLHLGSDVMTEVLASWLGLVQSPPDDAVTPQ